jgi:hypothetical protein
MNDDKPPPLASEDVTLELTKMVGSLKHFVLGVNELLLFDHQNHHVKLQLHSRKVSLIMLESVSYLTDNFITQIIDLTEVNTILIGTCSFNPRLKFGDQGCTRHSR